MNTPCQIKRQLCIENDKNPEVIWRAAQDLHEESRELRGRDLRVERLAPGREHLLERRDERLLVQALPCEFPQINSAGKHPSKISDENWS